MSIETIRGISGNIGGIDGLDAPGAARDVGGARPTQGPAAPSFAYTLGQALGSVEKQQLTPLDVARLISSIAATLFGYDECILREFSPESLLAGSAGRR